MANGYPPFIFQDAVPAQQMMAHAQSVNEGMRISELGKARQAEGMFRMAQLQQQKQAQQEKNELDRMIAQSQIAQNQLAQSFKEKELTQQATLAEGRNKNYLEGLRIQYPEGNLPPAVAAAQAKINYDRELERAAQLDDLSLEKQWNDITDQLEPLEAQRAKPIADTSWYEFIDRGNLKAEKKSADAQIEPKIISLKRQQQLIEAVLGERGKVPRRRAIAGPPGGLGAAPSTLDLMPPQAANPQLDEVKRRVAMAIQAGIPPAEAYARAAQLGFNLR